MPPENALSAVAYLSTAILPVPEATLEALLADARAFNQEVGVTGVLLLHDQTFFQYFEGPAEGVAQVYARIQASRLHAHLFELLHEPIANRAFSAWMMGFAVALDSLILQLEQAQWRREAAARRSGPYGPEGLNLLLQFWQRARSTR